MQDITYTMPGPFCIYTTRVWLVNWHDEHEFLSMSTHLTWCFTHTHRGRPFSDAQKNYLAVCHSLLFPRSISGNLTKFQASQMLKNNNVSTGQFTSLQSSYAFGDPLSYSKIC
jgi:hypothetical protein